MSLDSTPMSDDAPPPATLRQRAALVVNGTSRELYAAVSALAATGMLVASADSFAHAKELISIRPPDVLVTHLRLGEYNGLHLVLRAKAARPSLAAVVLASQHDAVLARETEQLGATFGIISLTAEDLLAAVGRTLFRVADGEPVRPPFERRRGERRQQIKAVETSRRGSERRQPLALRLRSAH